MRVALRGRSLDELNCPPMRRQLAVQCVPTRSASCPMAIVRTVALYVLLRFTTGYVGLGMFHLFEVGRAKAPMRRARTSNRSCRSRSGLAPWAFISDSPFGLSE